MATSKRMVRLRRSAQKIVTDNGRREVGLSATVFEPAVPIPTEGTLVAAEETTDERHLDGDRAGAESHACDRDGGPERDNLESAAVAVAAASSGDGHAARGGGDVAGNEGPRCIECGRRGWGVRLEFLSRSVYRLRRPALYPRLGPRLPSGPSEMQWALGEAHRRGAFAAQSVGHILDQRRRAAGVPLAIPAVLPDDPRVRDMVVPTRSLGAYDALARSGDKTRGGP